MKSRPAIVVALAVLCLTAGVAYVGVARDRVGDDIDRRTAEAEAFIDEWEGPVYAEGSRDPTGPTTTSTTRAPVASHRPPFQSGDLVFVNQIPGDDYGRLGLWRDETRTVFGLECDRAHASNNRLVCLSPAVGLAGKRATAEGFGASDGGFDSLAFGAVGIPSRARVATGGEVGASTVFVDGHSYLDTGQFATATNIFEFGDTTSVHSLENDYTVEESEPRHEASDGNWWGVTFGPDGDEFFVTYGAGGETEILRGSVSERRVTPYLQGVTCPSLSPDGAMIVAKRPNTDPDSDARFEMVALNVDDRRPIALAENRSVEDQVEWLDDDTILYALPHEGADDGPQPAMDIWSLDIAPNAEPELFLPFAASPGVVH